MLFRKQNRKNPQKQHCSEMLLELLTHSKCLHNFTTLTQRVDRDLVLIGFNEITQLNTFANSVIKTQI